MAVDLSGGTVWWLPVGASDVVPVTAEVLSYERDGTLTLAQPLPGVVGDIEIGDGRLRESVPPTDD